MKDSVALAAAAVVWNRARREALALRQQRADEGCENEAMPELGLAAVLPCWRTYTPTYDGDQDPLPRDQWCGPCLRRQAIHEQYREAVKRRGIAIRRVQQLALAADPERPAGHGAVPSGGNPQPEGLSK